MFCKKTTLLIKCLIIAFGLGLMTGCQSNNFPERGREELTKHVEALAGTTVTFQILSVEEAPGYSDLQVDLNVNYTGSSDEVSGCPEDEGGRNMWCVVLDREVTSNNGNVYSHFLVQRLGTSWYVDELGSTESDEFSHLGCRNWDAALTNQE